MKLTKKNSVVKDKKMAVTVPSYPLHLSGDRLHHTTTVQIDGTQTSRDDLYLHHPNLYPSAVYHHDAFGNPIRGTGQVGAIQSAFPGAIQSGIPSFGSRTIVAPPVIVAPPKDPEFLGLSSLEIILLVVLLVFGVLALLSRAQPNVAT